MSKGVGGGIGEGLGHEGVAADAGRAEDEGVCHGGLEEKGRDTSVAVESPGAVPPH